MPVQGILNIIIRKVLYTHRMVHKPLTVVPVERKRKGKEKTITEVSSIIHKLMKNCQWLNANMRIQIIEHPTERKQFNNKCYPIR